MAEYTLDISAYVCPMTFVKTKLTLEELEIGDLLTIRMRGFEPTQNVPRGLRDHGQTIVGERKLDDGGYEVVVRKER
ncbi:MAG: sulfurtransferase TusA family protein [Pseudomonadota bacterium]